MVYLSIEVTVTTVGNHTVEDEATKMKENTREPSTTPPLPFLAAPGAAGVEVTSTLRRSFTSLEHDVHRALISGLTPPVLLDIQRDTNVYIIHPGTSDRNKDCYAPYTPPSSGELTKIKWTEVAPEFFAAVVKSDGCTKYICGQIDKPVLTDYESFASLGSGKCGRSKAHRDHNLGRERAINAWEAIQKACVKADSWGTTLRVTENTAHIHR
ncbi:LOW QUALITY PROTEIN: hypothetical protein MKX08_009638 [Trichoderma sp. CBMAI-0020]|nr:LOW QUALITY PROTEIN: hypothetical protein MKX08_009638 [Trichoderma sp. CBMAI-0020]